MRKIIALIATAFLAFALSACDSGGSTDTSSETTTQTETAEGTWTYEEEGVKFVATISNGEMEIQWHPDETTSGLYWKGSFDVEELTDETVVVSKADTAALERSLYGAQTDEKTFVYQDGALKFDFIIMEITKEVSLTK